MSELVRFSVSLESDLLEAFDTYCKDGKFATRSEAIRQLLREKLTANTSSDAHAEIAASLTLVYDHHRTKLTEKMLEIQHAHGELVVATLHVHLDHELCMEIVTLRGKAAQLQSLAAELGGLKGIFQAQLVIARAVPGGNEHHHH